MRELCDSYRYSDEADLVELAARQGNWRMLDSICRVGKTSDRAVRMVMQFERETKSSNAAAKCVKRLVNVEIDPNVHLIEATKLDCIGVLQGLATAGGNLYITSADGRNLADIAGKYGYLKIFEWLEKRGVRCKDAREAEQERLAKRPKFRGVSRAGGEAAITTVVREKQSRSSNESTFESSHPKVAPEEKEECLRREDRAVWDELHELERKEREEREQVESEKRETILRRKRELDRRRLILTNGPGRWFNDRAERLPAQRPGALSLGEFQTYRFSQWRDCIIDKPQFRYSCKVDIGKIPDILRELGGRMKNKYSLEASDRRSLQEERIFASCPSCHGGAPGETLQLAGLHANVIDIRLSPDPVVERLVSGRCGNPGCESTTYVLNWDGGERQ